MPIPKRQQSARFPFQRLGEAFGVGTQAVSVKEPRLSNCEGIAFDSAVITCYDSYDRKNDT